ncbi:TPA: DNA primase, partial [Streptococcus suis]|nr:DNA primase [Streptococcus suis]
MAEFSEPTSMKELYNTLYELGAIWREEHQYTVNEGKKNEKVVIPIPEVSTVAKYLRQVCHFAFISVGDSSDKSPLYLYHYDKGIYTDSVDLFNKLCAKFDSRLKPRAWADIRAFIRTTTRIYKPFSDHTRIPVANGVFNLKTKQLEPFSPNFVITSK